MYLDHYELKEKPFQITADPKFLWMGEMHQEALSILEYGIMENKGFLILTGEVGTGKTVLINALVNRLDIETIVATVPDPDLETLDFFNFLSDGFQFDKTFDKKGDFLRHLKNFLHESNDANRKVLLIIDEAQRLHSQLLEEIRLLSNIELHDRKLINIFFVGQDEFNETLSMYRNRAVAQRISIRYTLKPLSETETGDYIKHRLEIAGTKQRIFKPSAFTEIYSFSGGIPRLINIVCDHALLTGYAIGKKQIDARIIRECAEELRIPEPVQRPSEPVPARPEQQPVPSEAAPLRTGNQVVPPHVFETDPSTADHPKDRQKELSSTAEPATGRPSEKKESEVRASKPGIEKEPEATEKKEKATSPRSLPTRLLVLFAAAALIAIIGILSTRMAPKEEPEWQLEDLAPTKYRDSLKKEGESLKEKLTEHTAAGTTSDARKSAADERTVDKASASPSAPSTGKAMFGSAKDLMSSEPVKNAEADSGTTKDDLSEKPLSASTEKTSPEKDGKDADKSDMTEPAPFKPEKFIIQFERNSNEIPVSSYNLLERMAAYLAEHPDAKISIKGYTDSGGSVAYNKKISEFRSLTVKSFLVGKGANPEKIEVVGMGPENPIASNDTPEGREKNRRIEIDFLPNE